MRRNMKLSSKLYLGFGVVVIVAGALAMIGWHSLSTVGKQVATAECANKCIKDVLEARREEKNFAMRGFKKLEQDTKNSVEKWNDVYQELVARIEDVKSSPQLSDEERALAAESLASAADYRAAFESFVASMEVKDDAFRNWGGVGLNYLASTNEAMEQIVIPAKTKAETAQDDAETAKWTQFESVLTKDVVQQFLLLRISAVYLLATNADEQWDKYQKQLELTSAGMERWRGLIEGNKDLRAATEKAYGFFEQYKAYAERYHEAILAGRKAESEMVAAARDITGNVEALRASVNNAMITGMARSNALMLALALAGMALGALLAVLITRGITKPINRIIEGLAGGAAQTTSASGQVAQSSQSMAEGATQQASSLEETSASLEELTSMTRQNAENANQAKSLSGEANATARQGAETMARMSQAIDEIKKSSDETAKIVKAIDDIAFQTNLLALNAAVEAARAGDAGKGFAVVAEEVRNLAQRSAEAARDTAAMIEESVKNADNGVHLSKQVAGALTQISDVAEKVHELVAEIASASIEQAQGIDQINTAVAQMDQVTQANAANSEESASASELLNAQAEEMQKMVEDLMAMVGGGVQRGGDGEPAKRGGLPGPIQRNRLALTQRRGQTKALSTSPGKATRNVVRSLDEKDLDSF